MTEIDYMRLAIAMAQKGIELGQSPFGAVIVHNGEVIACNHNTVWLTNDPTAHAEINSIRHAAAQRQWHVHFMEAEIYSTCEPCPMCLSAIHWARLRRVVYGASIADAQAAGFSELTVPAKHLADIGGSHLVVESGLLREECRALFDVWRAANGEAY